MRKKITIGLLIILLLVLGYAGFTKFNKNKSIKEEAKPEAYAVVGYVIAFDNNVLTVKGNPVVPENKEYNNAKYSQDYSVAISPDTKFTQIAISRPSAEDLKKSNGIFNIADLPRTQSEVNSEVFKKAIEDNQGLSLTIDSKNDIFEKNSFIADKITYTIQGQ